MNQLKTYRFKLKPTKAQAQSFAQWLGTCRYVSLYMTKVKSKDWGDFGSKCQARAQAGGLGSGLVGKLAGCSRGRSGKSYWLYSRDF